MFATITGLQTFVISDAEGEQLTRAAGNVLAWYDIPGVSEQTKDWIMLIQALGAVYGPRLLTLDLARKPRQAAPQAAPARPEARPTMQAAPTMPPPRNAPNPLSGVESFGPEMMRGMPELNMDLGG